MSGFHIEHFWQEVERGGMNKSPKIASIVGGDDQKSWSLETNVQFFWNHLLKEYTLKLLLGVIISPKLYSLSVYVILRMQHLFKVIVTTMSLYRGRKWNPPGKVLIWNKFNIVPSSVSHEKSRFKTRTS